jgi:nicotinamide-nucleotide amidase
MRNVPISIPTDAALSALSREVGQRLLDARRRLVSAESCTGGWIAKLCTDIPGSSDWFDCGFVCYSNAAKSRDLGVPEKLIETEGAVSDEVVRAMAEGALERTAANVAIAVSGIAGPGGAVPGKPVGTVWFALAHRRIDRLETQGHLIQFDGDRDAVRRQAVEYAFNLLRGLPPAMEPPGPGE